MKARLNSRVTKFSAGWLLTCYLVAAQSASAGVTEWVDIEVSNGRLLVDTEIAGIAGQAVIDTGAQFNGINEEFLATNDLSFPIAERVRIAGVFETSYRNVYEKVPVTIFGAEVEFKNLVEVNLGSPERQMTLGAGFLQLFIFQFDYPNQRMRAIMRDSLDLKKIKNVESRRDPQGGSPIVKVRLNDEKDVWLVMDTGNNGGVIVDRVLAEKQGWLDRYPTQDGVGVGVNSSGRVQRFTLPGLTIGEFNLANPFVVVPAEDETITQSEMESSTGSRIKRRRGKSQGLLGYDVLKHFVVTIDYRTGHVHIELGNSSQEGH